MLSPTNALSPLMRKVAVADIGSNSARLVVMRSFGDAAAIPVAESKLNLRLQLAIDDDGAVPDETIDRIVALLKDFRSVAEAAGAETLVAVGTSALRDSVNSGAVVKSVWQGSGVDLRILTGDDEAKLAFRGAVSSLPVKSGAALDVGGGSMEFVRFTDREPTGSVTLPLGALRVTDLCLPDGPTDKGMAALRAHIDETLKHVPFGPLTEGERVVGTGGTIRNLAKMHRRRSGDMFARLHGHTLPASEIESSIERLAGMKPSRRRAVSGLNPDRVESIVGGGAVALAAVKLMNADSILVSGTGLREGLALEAFGRTETNGHSLARQAARDMAQRFATWELEKAARRSDLVSLVCDRMPGALHPEHREAAELAAELLDTGTAVDFYSRFEATAWLVVNSNAGALTHRQIALISATCMAADKSSIQLARFKSEINKSEIADIKKAGAVLHLADEIEMRLGPAGAATLDIQPSQRKGEALTIAWDGSESWNSSSVLKQFAAAFKQGIGV